MPQVWSPDVAFRAPRIELQEDKESMTWLLELLHVLSNEGSLILNTEPLVPDSVIAPIARLADKYNVAGLVKAFFCATTINTWSREPFWQTFILGVATKDITLCRKSISKVQIYHQSRLLLVAGRRSSGGSGRILGPGQSH